MTNYNDGKWHAWNGGECPVHPDTVVDLMTETVDHWKEKASDINWDDGGAFRVIKEHREPREFWIDPSDGGVSINPVRQYIHVREVLDDE